MTSLELLVALGGFYNPSKEVQTVKFDGQEYLITLNHGRYQVFQEIDGDELLIGNI